MSSKSNKKPCIIIDNGSGFCKAGFGGEKEPKTIFSTCVGYPKYSSFNFSGNDKKYFVGKEAESKRGVLKLNYPIEHGNISNWDDIEKILIFIYNDELQVSSDEHLALLTEIPLNSNKNREKVAEIMFETFNVPGLCLENQALLTANYLGKSTGIVLDSGDGVTNCVPIIDSFAYSNGTYSLDFAGKELTEYLVNLMAENGNKFTSESEKKIVQTIKENACYVALNYEDELKSVKPYEYKLPDGTNVFIKEQRIKCPEALFNPSIINREGKGIAYICLESIQKCNKDLQKELYNNIILSGGNTMFKGLPERLIKEMKILDSHSMQDEIKINSNPERKLSAWKGGSILSTLSSFDDRWISKDEFDERGCSIIHQNLNNFNFESNLSKKKDKATPIYNEKLNLLPTIVVHVDYDGEINEELFNNLKKELSETINNNNISIIELNKGSAIFRIALLGELAISGIKASLYNNTSEEIDAILKKIETKRFVCLGNNYATEARYNMPNYSEPENRMKLVNFLNESKEGIIQASSAITEKEFENIIENAMQNVTDVAIAQEINQKQLILYKLEEFNNEIEKILDQARKESIFEFCVAGLSIINRDTTEYENNKNNCNNLKTRFLFHGTSSNCSTLIVTSNFREGKVKFFGPGIYMTDMLDYAGFYAFNNENCSKFVNHRRIRKKDETFVIVASQVYYDNSKYQKYYQRTEEEVPKEGIRFINVNAYGEPLSQDQTKENGYRRFIGTEYVIPSEKQILPLYTITLKRSEYYCLWKDYHFTHQTEFTKHALHVQNIAKQLLGINLYGVGEIDEALEIIKRKKYNKVIIMSNVGDNVEIAKQFIKDIREILQFNVVILFFTSKSRHSQWIKEIPNVLFTTRDKHFKDYILNFNENGLNKLKEEIEDDYGVKLDKFKADLSYPLYKEDGKYNSIEID